MQRGGKKNYLYRNLSFLLILIYLVASGFWSLHSLRHNNAEMDRLRSAVFVADEVGVDDATLERHVQALRHQVVNHMNTELQPPDTKSSEPPIQLPHKYYRDTIWYWQERIKPIDEDLPDGRIAEQFELARQRCEKPAYSISERLNCLVEETSDVDAMPEPPILRQDYYSFNFVSPTWSPDAAGWSLVLFGLGVIILFIRLFKF